MVEIHDMLTDTLLCLHGILIDELFIIQYMIFTLIYIFLNQKLNINDYVCY